MSNRLLGTGLLVLAALVAANLLMKNDHLWFVIDLLVIAGCGGIGILLLRRRT